jgi:hypothetical protein
MTRLLLRAFTAMVVAAIAYAIVLWITGGSVEYAAVATIVAVPVFLAVQRMIGGAG